MSPVSRKRNRKISGMIIQAERTSPSPEEPLVAPDAGAGLCRESPDAVGAGASRST